MRRLFPSFRWRVGAALALGAVVPSSALANGKFPEAGQLKVAPNDSSRLAVRSTHGVLVTSDGGATWDVICERGAGYQDIEPPIAVTASGALVLGLFEGVATSTPDGCDWALATGPDLFVPDVTSSPGGANIVAALTFDSVARQARYWTSTDEGATFTQAAGMLEAGFIPLTVDIALADGSRVYISGVRGSPERGALARSSDGGETWEMVDITGSDASSWPYIGALDPVDPDVIYVRLHTDPGRLLRTTDGGSTWNEIFSGPGFLRGLAVSPDGTQVVVGSEDGVWRAPTDTATFEQVSSTSVLCLTWHSDGLYACGHRFFNDGFAAARSTDAGETFTSLVSFSCIRGVLDCDASSSVGGECPSEWPTLSTQLDTDACGAESMPTSATATTASVTSTGASPTTPEAPAMPSGCDCAFAADRHGRSVPLAICVLALSALRRRRGCNVVSE